jgi:putative sigma-54 modulation protein
MTIDFVGRHLDLTPELREYAEEKVLKLGRLVDNLDIHVTLEAEKHRKTCGIVARGRNGIHTGEVTDEDLRQAITGAVDVLARQLRKTKTSRLSNRRAGAPSIRHQNGETVPVGPDGDDDELEAFLEEERV